jgi:hypothetical protein
MINIEINKIANNKVVMNVNQFNTIIDRLKKSEEVNISEIEEDSEILAVMKLQQESSTLDFLRDEKEDIYTVNDITEKYK